MEEEKYVINYIVHIHDNHGTINITQTGKPESDDPPPGTGVPPTTPP